jgi:hypothetical protein
MLASLRSETIWKLEEREKKKKSGSEAHANIHAIIHARAYLIISCFVPAAVGEDVVLPSLKLVCATYGIQDFLARLQA